jgi:Holliday junction resolvase RusA-like endonuclease
MKINAKLATTRSVGSIPTPASLENQGLTQAGGHEGDKDSPKKPKELFQFSVNGEPKGQPRPRAFARNMGGGKFVARVYEAGTAAGYKSAIAMAAKEAGAAGRMLDVPICLTVKCRFPRPKSHYRTGKRSRELRDNPPHWHTKKPDGDNIIKAIKDALTQVGVWRDDSLVCDESILKIYGNGIPSTSIIIRSLEE